MLRGLQKSPWSERCLIININYHNFSLESPGLFLSPLISPYISERGAQLFCCIDRSRGMADLCSLVIWKKNRHEALIIDKGKQRRFIDSFLSRHIWGTDSRIELLSLSICSTSPIYSHLHGLTMINRHSTGLTFAYRFDYYLLPPPSYGSIKNITRKNTVQIYIHWRYVFWDIKAFST